MMWIVKLAEKVGMAINDAIGCLDFDKRKGLMSALLVGMQN
jgi:hypothetical protein